MEEFEIKFLEVDVPSLEKKLLEIGAEKVGEYDYSRAIFDYPDYKMREKHSWLRLRTDGVESTLTYKQSINEKLNNGEIKSVGMKEIEVKVDDYEKTYKLLKAVGFIARIEEKNKRVRYVKDDVVFDLDFWPFIPPFLEVESVSFEKAESGARELGFDPRNSFENSVKKVYKKYGYDIDDYSSITFGGMIKK